MSAKINFMYNKRMEKWTIIQPQSHFSLIPNILCSFYISACDGLCFHQLLPGNNPLKKFFQKCLSKLLTVHSVTNQGEG